MAKIYHKEFKNPEDKKIIWTNEPKHENKFKKNLEEKSVFKTTLLDYLKMTLSKNAIDLLIFVH